MRIGVVGDTHDRLVNVDRIVELFASAAIERVVHTGDITRPDVLERFARLRVPLLGVFGNNDRHERARLHAHGRQYGMDLVDPPLTLEWAGRRILVIHDPEEVPSPIASEPEPAYDLLLHGHTHRHRLEQQGETLIFNPGECAGSLAGRNAVGVVDLVSLDTELLRF